MITNGRTWKEHHGGRIGHGIGAIEDRAVIDEILEKDLVLEVCPGSNVVLNAVRGWGDHPIAKLRDMGVKVTVSTDDPPFFHTTMTAEFDMLNRTFGWETEDFQQLNKAALAAAFCDEDTLSRIAKRLEPAT